MSKFSAGLMLTDLDDFISPSQECIKPVKIDKSQEKSIASIEVDVGNNEYYQVNLDGSRSKLKKAKIELSDCLACSGCVTSAESVLVNQQSVDEFLDRLKKLDIMPLVVSEERIQTLNENDNNSTSSTTQKKRRHVLVVSISPQSRASLAAYFGITSPLECMQKLNTFCREYLGAEYVFDTTWSRNLSLVEMCHEFVDKYNKEKELQQQAASEGAEGSSVAGTTTAVPASVLRRQRRAQKNKIINKHLPVLTSACPGWICYAEKTQGDMLPYVSTTKSPQAIMGSVVKQHFMQQRRSQEDIDIFHVAVMPCFDKKLEASRDEFKIPGGDLSEEDLREVDLVLTSSELLEIIEKHKKVDFATLAPSKIDPLFNELVYAEDSQQFKLGGLRGVSGGYAETVLRYAALTLFGKELKPEEIEFKKIRNEDFKEYSLELEGKKVLHFAICNGFRNIQNLVRKLKEKQCEYDFVEVMACPSGCTNGGGQIKAPQAVIPRDFLKQVETTYQNVELIDPSPLQGKAASPIVSNPMEMYEQWVADKVYSEKAKKLLHTTYTAREKLNINPLTIKW